ncbi:uncharacterized protein LOC143020359 [Oratosquilla oratoria]|uniref:uncharacterized protein LOC143020359 n=1 Tax=Oratosquilla oratoria TaxID=337810 RepID=UPI003F77002E
MLFAASPGNTPTLFAASPTNAPCHAYSLAQVHQCSNAVNCIINQCSLLYCPPMLLILYLASHGYANTHPASSFTQVHTSIYLIPHFLYVKFYILFTHQPIHCTNSSPMFPAVRLTTDSSHCIISLEPFPTSSWIPKSVVGSG